MVAITFDTMTKQKVQEQFGRSAEAYATSAVHAKGASLSRLVEILRPQSHWRALDIATAAGHTALAFAPYARQVIAADLTPAMLPVARNLAGERGVSNIILAAADAENLPFASSEFDLVTCRIAPHHFPDVARFVAESVRVLRPGGVLAVVDNVVPGVYGVRGRQARRQAVYAARYVNAFEKLRDPSHHHCLALDEWLALFRAAGLQAIEHESAWKAIDFDDWVARMHVSATDTMRLRVMLQQAPAAVLDFLAPSFQESRLVFRLAETIMVGRKAVAAYN